MLVSQMFPSKTLDANDLRAFNPGVTPVTIEKIDFKTVEASDFGEAGIVYYIQTREFKKPFSLNRTKAQAIADVLGSDDTDHWIGRRIGIMYGTVSVPAGNGQRKKIPVIDVDIQPIPDGLPGPNLPPRSDITGYAMQARSTMQGTIGPTMPRPAVIATTAQYTGAARLGIGPKNAEKFKGALAEQGATMDDCLHWLKANDQTAYEGCHGKILEDWPAGAAVAMSLFLREYGLAKQAPQAGAGAGGGGGIPTTEQVAGGLALAPTHTTADIPF